VARQKHHGGRARERKAVYLLSARKQRERDRKRPFKGMTPVAYFLQPDITS
jgi:hypothetical protein